jgi:hypothetical protein
MRQKEVIEYRGFGLGHVLIAALAGAAAGALFGAVKGHRIGRSAEGAKDTVARVPYALRQATEAAREAFNEALCKEDA